MNICNNTTHQISKLFDITESGPLLVPTDVQKSREGVDTIKHLTHDTT